MAQGAKQLSDFLTQRKANEEKKEIEDQVQK
eukprot:CAMPEP_0170564668 /NCGR_PEP_ID=MMETSP0211-20121228/74235_1 /TAXON_ID=311385 /ORGANISM="Pseudokeronopsis sp., Strain OXSARD2" /LENGTH=30 /DNA_ID= /DNA_START= /DNA_END= /DNA_ORIENTATION=